MNAPYPYFLLCLADYRAFEMEQKQFGDVAVESAGKVALGPFAHVAANNGAAGPIPVDAVSATVHRNADGLAHYVANSIAKRNGGMKK